MRLESKSESSFELTKECSAQSIAGDEEKLLQNPGASSPPSSQALPLHYGDWFNAKSFPKIDWVSDISRTMEGLWGPTAEAKRRSEAIDRYLDEESRSRDRQLTVAMFGNREQKNILWKHVRLLEQPLSTQERCDLLPQVRGVVLNIVRAVLTELDEELTACMKGKNNDTEFDPWIQDIRETLALRWEGEVEETVNRVLALNNETFYAQLAQHGLKMDELYCKTQPLDESGFYACPCHDSKDVLKLAERVYGTGYYPTDHDFLHFDHRLSPIMIREARVDMKGYSICLQDPVRNRGERRKWIHVLENATCVLFVADIALYDVTLFENISQNYLEEQALLFNSVASFKWVAPAPILLILSNISAFKSKLETSPLSKLFTDYEGKTPDDAIAYITSVFLRASDGRSGIHFFHLNAYDEQDVRDMLNSMGGTVLKPALAGLGLSP